MGTVQPFDRSKGFVNNQSGLKFKGTGQGASELELTIHP